MNIANFLTIIRIILVPFFIYSLYNYPLTTFIPRLLFIICILTDFFDGILARNFKMKTKIGSFLDPSADKILLLSTYFVLSSSRLSVIPVWLFLIILGRDIIILFGWLLIYILTGISKINTRLSGKITVLFETLSVLVVLFSLPFTKVMFNLTAFVTLISLIDYCIIGFKKIVNHNT